MTDRDPSPQALRSRPLLERSDLSSQDRARVGRAVAGLLGWGLVASAVLGILAIWHLVRRGRILRANLAPPKIVSLPEIDAKSGPFSTS